jgi:hypothetical protein
MSGDDDSSPVRPISNHPMAFVMPPMSPVLPNENRRKDEASPLLDIDT